MKEIKKIAIVGLGAIGAIYGSKLLEINPDNFKVIANEARAAKYSKEGLKINGKTYYFNCVDPKEKTEAADLIIVAVKHHHLPQTIKDIKNHVGPETIILSLMNGISSEEILGEEYGMEKVMYGICVGIDAVRTAAEIQCSTMGVIHFGEKVNKTYSDRVEGVKQLFEKAGISYNIPEDIMRALWWKFMVNVGINQTSAVLKAPYKVFQEVKEANELMMATMKEVIALSKKERTNLKDEDLDSFRDILNKLAPDGKTSMLQDIEAGRKTEVEMFAGTICELGKKHGIETPMNEALLKMIQTLEKMNEKY
ncbi:ketopantoate reductase [Natronincola peptidivorans]|uniref:2-dehydropantoate 2-reductase n=1 Tax=Natronincola peptidivorans TaxID=426128 RepID=A0A1I0BTK3_9FIRM|nr:ketopantoate reductase family protein [Natronincola peptidivorans]SET10294.1 ketopantoate reductase [Natronincola peptidivorans]